VKHLDSKVSRPAKELKGFARIFLKKGETRRVSIPLQARQLSYWDVARQRWVLEKESVRLMVGVSSEKIRLEKTIEIL
jgi:beta-glucosidase